MVLKCCQIAESATKKLHQVDKQKHKKNKAEQNYRIGANVNWQNIIFISALIRGTFKAPNTENISEISTKRSEKLTEFCCLKKKEI